MEVLRGRLAIGELVGEIKLLILNSFVDCRYAHAEEWAGAVHEVVKSDAEGPDVSGLSMRLSADGNELWGEESRRACAARKSVVVVFKFMRH